MPFASLKTNERVLLLLHLHFPVSEHSALIKKKKKKTAAISGQESHSDELMYLLLHCNNLYRQIRVRILKDRKKFGKTFSENSIRINVLRI